MAYATRSELTVEQIATLRISQRCFEDRIADRFLHEMYKQMQKNIREQREILNTPLTRSFRSTWS